MGGAAGRPDAAPDPIEVTLPLHGGASGRGAVSVRRARLHPGDVVVARGLPSTSTCRTLLDVALREPPDVWRRPREVVSIVAAELDRARAA